LACFYRILQSFADPAAQPASPPNRGQNNKTR
jgi:hypothetical protein